MTSCDWVMHGIMNLMSVLILPSRMESRLLLEDVLVPEFNSDVEEISTRSQDISMDYDFFHSHEMSLECGNDYEMKVVPHDLNVWLSRMYLGDADGFSIMYYSDVDSIVYWANEAAYTYGVSGIAIWSLGQEDMRLWDSMPDQI